jgi:hypothetical protein
MSDRIRSAGVAGPDRRAAAFVAATRRTLARIEDLFSGHLPAPIELLSKVTQNRLLPARSRLSVHDWFCGAPVARITLIR